MDVLEEMLEGPGLQKRHKGPRPKAAAMRQETKNPGTKWQLHLKIKRTSEVNRPLPPSYSVTYSTMKRGGRWFVVIGSIVVFTNSQRLS
jgi:hypothetical protein